MDYYYKDDHCTIYHGDCREILPEIPKVDLVFTSPPYWYQRDYEMESFDWIDSVAKSLPNCNITETGQILVNLGLVHIDGEIRPYWNYLIDEMKKHKYKWFGKYVWDQGFGLPGNWNGRLGPSYEEIFHFNKKPRELKKWIKTTERKPSKLGMRKKDGTVGALSSPGKAGGKYKIPDNVIRVMREQTRDWDHPARFPEALPKFILKTFYSKTILDPFMGSGTTLRAAKDLNRKAIGIELEEKYCEIAVKRLQQEVMQF